LVLYLVKLMHFSLFEYNFVYLSLAYRTKTYRKYQNIHILLFHLRASDFQVFRIFSEPGSSSQHGKPFLLKGNFISISVSFTLLLTLKQYVSTSLNIRIKNFTFLHWTPITVLDALFLFIRLHYIENVSVCDTYVHMIICISHD